MFDELYSSEYYRSRQIRAPLAREREAFLEHCVARGDARTSVIRKAERALALAGYLRDWPDNHLFTEEDLGRLADRYVKESNRLHRAKDLSDVVHKFKCSVREFLGFLGRLAPSAVPVATRYGAQVEEFIRDHYMARGAAFQTMKQSRNLITRFLRFFEQARKPLSELTAEHIDGFIHHLGQRWCRRSMSHAGYNIRNWVAYCERRGWIRTGLSGAILTPKVYSHEGLPLGPDWNEVGQVVRDLNDRIRKLLRDRAILLLLSVYGLRAGEVCAMQVDDVDWERSQLRIRNVKRSREVMTHLERNVGEAMLAYLQFGRPPSTCPKFFLRTNSPVGPLTSAGISALTKVHSCRVLGEGRGWHPHALRHACARHLLASGFTLKRISDHLVHASIRSTTVYAKVDLPALREVAFKSLEGLV